MDRLEAQIGRVAGGSARAGEARGGVRVEGVRARADIGAPERSGNPNRASSARRPGAGRAPPQRPRGRTGRCRSDQRRARRDGVREVAAHPHAQLWEPSSLRTVQTPPARRGRQSGAAPRGIGVHGGHRHQPLTTALLQGARGADEIQGGLRPDAALAGLPRHVDLDEHLQVRQRLAPVPASHHPGGQGLGSSSESTECTMLARPTTYLTLFFWRWPMKCHSGAAAPRPRAGRGRDRPCLESPGRGSRRRAAARARGGPRWPPGCGSSRPPAGGPRPGGARRPRRPRRCGAQQQRSGMPVRSSWTLRGTGAGGFQRRGARVRRHRGAGPPRWSGCRRPPRRGRRPSWIP